MLYLEWVIVMNLDEIKGVGPKTLKLLNKLGIYNGYDLICYYPFRYVVVKRTDFSSVEDNDDVVIDGVVESRANLVYLKGKRKLVSFRLNTGRDVFTILAYNRPYLVNEIKIGSVVTVMGKYNRVKRSIVASSVSFGKLSDVPYIEPIYYTTYGLSRKCLAKIIDNYLDSSFTVLDEVPSYLSLKYGFIDKKDAILQIHRPNNMELLKKARLRIKYEELFSYMLKINYLKQKNKINEKAIRRNVDRNKIEDFIFKLPFKLTDDQRDAVFCIFDDLSSDIRMNRLLQGDVGSGKTIVAFISAYINFLSGYQTAIMVPTEILARQHLESALNIFKEIDIRIEMLTSSVKAQEKRRIINDLENGDIDLIIGTQSLIQEDIKYHNLGLVITDEQHRFGVNQRNVFKNKGEFPDVLSMSATPIPRTYALTIYGDLDVSSIKTKPVGRKDVITKVVLESEIVKALEMMNDQLKLGHQVYVIAPLIMGDDDALTESVDSILKKMEKAFGKKYKIGVVHGKLDSKTKDKTMEEFNNNVINILISTTVIEVGVDVKNATMMVIFDANNFGLSTLHQLRGRVGRSDIQSYCLLVTKVACERLNFLENTNDGFVISEYDFEHRGEGDLFGIRQSGEMNFKLADIHKDYKILVQAKEDACDYLNRLSSDEIDALELEWKVRDLN